MYRLSPENGCPRLHCVVGELSFHCGPSGSIHLLRQSRVLKPKEPNQQPIELRLDGADRDMAAFRRFVHLVEVGAGVEQVLPSRPRRDTCDPVRVLHGEEGCRSVNHRCIDHLTLAGAVKRVEAIGRNSNLGHRCKKWSDLRKRFDESSPRPPLLYQDKPKTRSRRFLTPQDVIDIIHRYDAGETTQQVGTRYGISKTRVATVLRERGVTIRRQGLNDEQVTEAAMFYAAGRSLAWLGARYDVSHTTIAAALRQEGVRLRPRPGWG